MPNEIKLTPSAIEDYEGCPLHFRKAYIDRAGPRTQKSSPDLALGTSLHDYLYLYHSSYGATSPDDETVRRLLERSWVSRGYADRQQEEVWREDALRLCRQYHVAFSEEPATHLGHEIFLQKPLRVGGNSVLLSGKIDRLSVWPDGHLEVVDYKTTKAVEPSPARLSLSLSAFLYYVLARTNYPDYARVEVSYIYLRSARKVTTTYGDEVGMACKARLLEAIQQITSGVFPATPSQRCAWCEFTEACPGLNREEVDLDNVI